MNKHVINKLTLISTPHTVTWFYLYSHIFIAYLNHRKVIEKWGFISVAVIIITQFIRHQTGSRTLGWYGNTALWPVQTKGPVQTCVAQLCRNHKHAILIFKFNFTCAISPQVWSNIKYCTTEIYALDCKYTQKRLQFMAKWMQVLSQRRHANIVLETTPGYGL